MDHEASAVQAVLEAANKWEGDEDGEPEKALRQAVHEWRKAVWLGIEARKPRRGGHIIPKKQYLGRITIPGRAESQNAVNRMGMRDKMRAKKQWRSDACKMALVSFPRAYRLVSGGCSQPHKRLRRIVVISYRLKLVDSAMESLAGGACKHYVDGLKDAGVTWDDSEKWCIREYEQVVVKTAREERTEIEVWE